GHWRIRRRRHPGLPWPAIPAVYWRRKRGLRIRCVADGAVGPGEPHQPAIGCRGGLWRRRCRRRARSRRTRDRTEERKGRRLASARPAGRIDGQCRPERVGNFPEVSTATRRFEKGRSMKSTLAALATSLGLAVSAVSPTSAAANAHPPMLVGNSSRFGYGYGYGYGDGYGYGGYRFNYYPNFYEYYTPHASHGYPYYYPLFHDHS